MYVYMCIAYSYACVMYICAYMYSMYVQHVHVCTYVHVCIQYIYMYVHMHVGIHVHVREILLKVMVKAVKSAAHALHKQIATVVNRPTPLLMLCIHNTVGVKKKCPYYFISTQ